ncbi:hypothetical protein [Komagataeibacter sp. FNDCR2]|uniref:hypothetical protein n=1 Tax=Komagataeibacter sp. FNDCR2 TaxID=2878682 RepID=UPI001E39D8CD|nr:hypothetical protein [Komagataeibacter sp. FNDCR2]MCE2574300.1 hypothetical protein [Komagataeibacter sp. FNDCR2]
MSIGSVSSIIGNAAQYLSGSTTEHTGDSQSGSVDFSNISAQKLQDVNEELTQQGKITFRQSGELSLMDGWALRGVNNGQLRQSPTGTLDAYSLLDTMIKYQESNGIGDVGSTVASLSGLKETLENYAGTTTEDTAAARQVDSQQELGD